MIMEILYVLLSICLFWVLFVYNKKVTRQRKERELNNSLREIKRAVENRKETALLNRDLDKRKIKEGDLSAPLTFIGSFRDLRNAPKKRGNIALFCGSEYCFNGEKWVELACFE